MSTESQARLANVTRPDRVITGAERLAADPALVRGRVGLVTNFTGTMPDLSRNVEAFRLAGVDVAALFGPEHGLAGSVQAGFTESSARDEASGLKIFETYLASPDDLDAMILDSGVDTLVFDMQDIGVRYYTYVWTMYDCMLAAARTGRRFVVLDRPNPLSGAVSAGPWLDEDYASFVGRVSIPLRHGLTAAELARYIAARVLPRASTRPLDLDVVALAEWDRHAYFDETGLAWVPPSPNIPTLDTALAFAGLGLFEGTNVSEGRGTTRPFETIGAPYVDGRLADAVRELALPGVLARPVWFAPTFHKYVGQTIGGIQFHITDRATFDPVRTALSAMAVLNRLYPDDFAVLEPGKRVESGAQGYAIDRLWGSDTLRHAIAAHDDLPSLSPPSQAPHEWAGEVLLYRQR